MSEAEIREALEALREHIRRGYLREDDKPRHMDFLMGFAAGLASRTPGPATASLRGVLEQHRLSCALRCHNDDCDEDYSRLHRQMGAARMTPEERAAWTAASDRMGQEIVDLRASLAAKDAEFAAALVPWREASDRMGAEIVELRARVATMTMQAEAEAERRAGVEQSYADNLMSLQAELERIRQESFTSPDPAATG